jgi:hypothetical protein
MSECVISCVKAVAAGLIATAVMLGTGRAALADDCLAGPDRPPAPGGHWYYHLDRAADRKCWYLVEPARAPATETAEPQPASEPPPQLQSQPQPAFGAFFSSLGFGSPPPQPDPGDARITLQSIRPADPRSDEAAGRQPRVARRPVAEASLAQKPHRPVHARTPTEHADEPAASPAQAERDALFQQFLKWRERQ